MVFKYSATTGGFYAMSRQYTLPSDCVDVSEAVRDACMVGQGLGLIVRPDAHGYPVLVTAPPSEVAVTRLQALGALLQAGLLPSVEAYMADPSVDAFTKLAWKEAQEFRTDSHLVKELHEAVGITKAQLRDLFTFASTIEA